MLKSEDPIQSNKSNLILSIIKDTGLIPNDFHLDFIHYSNNVSSGFRISPDGGYHKSLAFINEDNSICFNTGNPKTESRIKLPNSESVLDSDEFQDTLLHFFQPYIKEWLVQVKE